MGDVFFLLGFAIVAGIVLQSGEKKRRSGGGKTAVLQSGGETPHSKTREIAEQGRSMLRPYEGKLFSGEVAPGV